MDGPVTEGGLARRDDDRLDLGSFLERFERLPERSPNESRRSDPTTWVELSLSREPPDSTLTNHHRIPAPKDSVLALSVTPSLPAAAAYGRSTRAPGRHKRRSGEVEARSDPAGSGTGTEDGDGDELGGQARAGRQATTATDSEPDDPLLVGRGRRRAGPEPS